ncbi:MAG: response regulator receiver protein [Bryobacterales bacterium]|nr:response regulator receiver protein [Bryobacterales bacterium]
MATIPTLSNPAAAASAASIALIVPDSSRRASLARILGGLHLPVLRECPTYPESRYLEELMALDCDVFIVDLDTNVDQALGLIENICSRDAAATVMATSRSNDAGLLIRSMRAGAREFLPEPIVANTITEAVARALARREKSQQKNTVGKILMFAGAKGGSGVTTLATNFAIALTKEDAGKVLIVDMDLQMGEVALGLGFTPQFSILDALKNEERLDTDFLMTMLTRHISGLAVLASPEQYTSFHASASGVQKLFNILRHEFAFVVVDAGTTTCGAEETLLDLADTVYLVTEVSIPALRNARRLMSFMAGRDRNPHVEVILNRFNARQIEIDENSATKALARPVDWKIPNDFPSVRTAENTGVPLALKDSPISRVMHKMAVKAAGKPALAEKRSLTLRGLFSMNGQLECADAKRS